MFCALLKAKISGERLQDHWSSGSFFPIKVVWPLMAMAGGM